MTTASASNVVFDLGGVLIDWNPRYLYRDLFKGDEAAMEDFLARICTSEWNVRQDAGRSIAEAEAELLQAHPAQGTLIRAYYAGFDRMLKGAIAGTVAILEELAARGTPLFALTNWSRETFPHARRRFAFLERFKDIVVSGEINLIKPDRRIYDHLCRSNAIEAARSLFIDDAEKNVAGARAAGWQAIRFVDPARLRVDLATRGLL